MIFCLCSQGWYEELLQAQAFPKPYSISYVEDLRHLFSLRLERELKAMGIPLVPKMRIYRDRSVVHFVDCSEASEQTDLPRGFYFGADDELHSFAQVNYQNARFKDGRPIDFLDAEQPLSLGNFSVGIDRSIDFLTVYPPAEIAVTGVATIKTAKRGSLLLWLGVSYQPKYVPPWVPVELELLGVNTALQYVPTMTYAYASEFAKHFAGDRYALEPDEEMELRKAMGFPSKGKPVRELILYYTVCEIFGKENVVHRYRGRELQGLEIDVWVPGKKLGFEYQGQQHFQRLRHWQSEVEFQRQLDRDKRKNDLCQQLGIRLFYFKAGDDLDRVSVVRLLRAARILG